MKRITILCAALMLAACGRQAIYVKPDVDPADRERDSIECRYEAEVATAGIRNELFQAGERLSLFERCMQVRGYSKRYVERH